mmetsp:Transcript_12151/g.24690  ORF Transcript_12151/g.24690 Transcript_12151/m.24690 type:complete len:371 (+) Transcript_12151:21-1133(+)
MQGYYAGAFIMMLMALTLGGVRSFPLNSARLNLRKVSRPTSTTTLSRLFLSSSVTDPEMEEYANPNNRDDQILSLISADGGLKVTLVTLRNLMNDLSLDQNLSPLATRALGSSFSCASMLASGMDGGQVFQMTMSTDGPLRGSCTIASSDGGLKGYVGNPTLGDSLTLPEAVGSGTLQIVKNHPSWPRPYNGISEVVSGLPAEDVAIYLARSEQRSCAIHSDVRMNGYLCTGAGGYLVEKLPGCDSGPAAVVEANLEKLGKEMGKEWFVDELCGGRDLVSVAKSCIGEGIDLKVLDSVSPRLKCDCSQERFVRSLTLLPKADIDEIVERGEPVEAKCEFCAKVYRLGPDEMVKEMEEYKKRREEGAKESQ